MLSSGHYIFPHLATPGCYSQCKKPTKLFFPKNKSAESTLKSLTTLKWKINYYSLLYSDWYSWALLWTQLPLESFREVKWYFLIYFISRRTESLVEKRITVWYYCSEFIIPCKKITCVERVRTKAGIWTLTVALFVEKGMNGLRFGRPTLIRSIKTKNASFNEGVFSFYSGGLPFRNHLFPCGPDATIVGFQFRFISFTGLNISQSFFKLLKLFICP